MIYYGIAASNDAYRKQMEDWAIPSLARIGVPRDRVFVSGHQTSLHAATNEMLDWAMKQPDLEALVTLHPDLEIRDPSFEAKIREGLSDPEVAVVGIIGAGGVWSARWWEGIHRHGSILHEADQKLPSVHFDRGTFDVDVVDGCLMALSPWMVRNYRADVELFVPPAWHSCSDDLCLTAKRRMKKRVLVMDIEATHHTTVGIFTGGKDHWDRLDRALQVKHRMGMSGSVGVVITVCGHPELLDLQMRSHRIYSAPDLKFVVVDATTDPSRSARKVAEEYGAVYVESPGTPQGASSNKGIDVARGLGVEWIVLANDDLVVGPGWGTRMFSEWDMLSYEHYKPGILGASSNYVAGKQSRCTALRAPSLLSTKVVISFFALTRADIMEQIGGYAPIQNGSDLGMSYRLAKAGYSSFISSIFIHHFGSQSLGPQTMDAYVADIEKGNAWMDENCPAWREVLAE